MESYGLLSLVPPLLAIGLAFATKQVLPSLFISIWVGAAILHHGNPVAGFADMIVKYIAGSIAEPWNAAILVISITLGGMIGIISKSGGMKAVADFLARKARTANGGQFVTYLMGIIIFFDDYANTLLVGNTMRPLCDRLKISREKLAYLCDSTAAPVASIALLSTWTAYEMGLLRNAFITIGLEMNVYEAFVRSIPFRFYSMVLLAFMFMITVLGRDFGPMLKAERRARTTGKLFADGAVPLASRELTDMKIKKGIPLRWFNAIIPVLTVVFMIVVGLYVDGRGRIMSENNTELVGLMNINPFTFRVIGEVIGHSQVDRALMWAVFTGTLVAIVLVIVQRILTLTEAVSAWVEGAKSMLFALLIIVLAWGIGSLCKDLGTAKYLVSALEGKISPGLIPPLVFIIGCVIAFSTGTSYGTMAIMIPIAVPLAYHLSGGQTGGIFFATIGATFTGAVFGDHCSPISDTTIMSSMACASDHLDHVKTQMPYAVTVAAITVVAGFIPAAHGVNPFISIAFGAFLSYLVVRFIGKKV
ncbi:Na+/H+ antiporter NhaC family protein [bacterium]|nr:Na+/H+ antiporter NhaC family protein [bacterium]